MNIKIKGNGIKIWFNNQAVSRNIVGAKEIEYNEGMAIIKADEKKFLVSMKNVNLIEEI